MPIKETIIHDFYTKIIVWELTESAKELLLLLSLDEKKIGAYKNLPLKQGLEYLGISACLKELAINLEINYTEKGKPFLDNKTFLSISHSNKMVCVGVSNIPIGIDIEFNKPKKIENIQSKFLCEDEKNWLENKPNKIDFLQIIWGIKESLYKLDGGNLYNFINHYKVTWFDLIEDHPIICSIIENEKNRNFSAFYRKIEDYFLVWTI